MKEKEYFNINENKDFKEYKSFEAKEYHKSYEKINFSESKDFSEDNLNKIIKEENIKDSNTLNYQEKPKTKKKEKIDLKNRIKLAMNTSMRVATTLSVVAFASVVSSEVLDKNEEVNINSLDIGSSYLYLDLSLDSINSKSNYYIEIEGVNFNEVIAIDNGYYNGKIDSLIPESKYNLEIYAINEETNNRKTIYDEDIYTSEREKPIVSFDFSDRNGTLSYLINIIDIDNYTTDEKVVFIQDNNIIYQELFNDNDTIAKTMNSLQKDTKVIVYGYHKNKEIVIGEYLYEVKNNTYDNIITSFISYSNKDTITYDFSSIISGEYDVTIYLYNNDNCIDTIYNKSNVGKDSVLVQNQDVDKYNIIIKKDNQLVYQSNDYSFYSKYNKEYLKDSDITYDIIQNKLQVTINDYSNFDDNIFIYKVKLLSNNMLIDEQYFNSDTIYFDNFNNIQNTSYKLIYEVVRNNGYEEINYGEAFQRELNFEVGSVVLDDLKYIENGKYDLRCSLINSGDFIVDSCIVILSDKEDERYAIESRINVENGTRTVRLNGPRAVSFVKATVKTVFRFNSYTFEIIETIEEEVPKITLVNSYIEMLDSNIIYIEIAKNYQFDIMIYEMINNSAVNTSYTIENNKYKIITSAGIHTYKIAYVDDNNIIYDDVSLTLEFNVDSSLVGAVDIDTTTYDKILTQNADGSINMYKLLKHNSGNGFLRVELINRSSDLRYSFDAKDHYASFENIELTDYIINYYLCEYVDFYYIVTNISQASQDGIYFGYAPTLITSYDGNCSNVSFFDTPNIIPQYAINNNIKYDFTIDPRGKYQSNIDGYITVVDKVFVYDNNYYPDNASEIENILNQNNVTIKGNKDILISYDEVGVETMTESLIFDLVDTTSLLLESKGTKVFDIFIPNEFINYDVDLYDLKVVLTSNGEVVYESVYVEEQTTSNKYFIFSDVDFNNINRYRLEYHYYVKYQNEFIKIDDRSYIMSDIIYDDATITMEIDSGKVNIQLSNNYDIYNASIKLSSSFGINEYYLDLENDILTFTDSSIISMKATVDCINIYTNSGEMITLIIGKILI